ALFAEGAFSAAFIPLFNKKAAEANGDLRPALDFAEDAQSVLLPVLIVMTAIMELAAWPVTYALSGGFNSISDDQFAFAVTLS
ncbi:lipid II flippase MurJ, partial [Salmonella enterica]|uniref:lipid II flippase MurJ n=1 Tax=Salmonella enterica TaxID=28901 RepID=UPI003D27BC1A